MLSCISLHEKSLGIHIDLILLDHAILASDRIDTVFLFADPGVSYVSSSSARQLAEYGGDLEAFLPEELIAEVRDHFKE